LQASTRDKTDRINLTDHKSWLSAAQPFFHCPEQVLFLFGFDKNDLLGI